MLSAAYDECFSLECLIRYFTNSYHFFTTRMPHDCGHDTSGAMSVVSGSRVWLLHPAESLAGTRVQVLQGRVGNFLSSGPENTEIYTLRALINMLRFQK